VAQYGASHTLARPKTPTRSENRTLSATRNVFHDLLSHHPTRSTPDPLHEPRYMPCPAPTPPHAPPGRLPPESGPLRRSARAPPPRSPPESSHHVASEALTLQHFWLPWRLPLAAWPTATRPPLTAALAVAAWLERSVERKMMYKKVISSL
jgi:hypothetical protein